MSLGRDGTVDDNPPLRAAVKKLYDAGVTIVVAAGNDATKEVSQKVPASYPEVLAVASTTAISGTNSCRWFSGVIAADTASYFTTDGKGLGWDATTGQWLARRRHDFCPRRRQREHFERLSDFFDGHSLDSARRRDHSDVRNKHGCSPRCRHCRAHGTRRRHPARAAKQCAIGRERPVEFTDCFLQLRRRS
jgi:hypothetical protein